MLTFLKPFTSLAKALHTLSVLGIATLAVAVLGYTMACAFGLAPWLSLGVTFGTLALPQAGPVLQISVTVMLAMMAFYLPSQARIMALEHSHRRFQLTMDDIARAYHLCHTADRAGLFTMSSEFDQVRERLAHMRDHPDLEKLEPGVLEVAAQMSQQAQHLSAVYSDEKVMRAKEFLTQRQQEVEAQQDRIVEALYTCQEISKWAEQLEIEEGIVASQLAQLDEKLHAALPHLGYQLELEPSAPSNVIPLPQHPAAE